MLFIFVDSTSCCRPPDSYEHGSWSVSPPRLSAEQEWNPSMAARYSCRLSRPIRDHERWQQHGVSCMRKLMSDSILRHRSFQPAFSRRGLMGPRCRSFPSNRGASADLAASFLFCRSFRFTLAVFASIQRSLRTGSSGSTIHRLAQHRIRLRVTAWATGCWQSIASAT